MIFQIVKLAQFIKNVTEWNVRTREKRDGIGRDRKGKWILQGEFVGDVIELR